MSSAMLIDDPRAVRLLGINNNGNLGQILLETFDSDRGGAVVSHWTYCPVNPEDAAAYAAKKDAEEEAKFLEWVNKTYGVHTPKQLFKFLTGPKGDEAVDRYFGLLPTDKKPIERTPVGPRQVQYLGEASVWADVVGRQEADKLLGQNLVARSNPDRDSHRIEHTWTRYLDGAL